MRHFIACNLLGLFVLGLNGVVAAQARVEQFSVKSMVATALATGSAQSWVGGELAERFLENVVPAQKNAQILLSVRKLQDLGEDCGRFEVVTSKPGAFFKSKDDGKRIPAEIGMQINLCADGSAPIAGIDLKNLAPGVAPLRSTRPPIDIK